MSPYTKKSRDLAEANVVVKTQKGTIKRLRNKIKRIRRSMPNPFGLREFGVQLSLITVSVKVISRCIALIIHSSFTLYSQLCSKYYAIFFLHCLLYCNVIVSVMICAISNVVHIYYSRKTTKDS